MTAQKKKRSDTEAFVDRLGEEQLNWPKVNPPEAVKQVMEFSEAIDEVPFGLVGGNINYLDHFYDVIDALRPNIAKRIKRAQGFLKELGLAADKQRLPLARSKSWEVDSDYGLVKMESAEAGFQIGIIVGARLAGMTPEQLQRLAKGLTRELGGKA